MIKKILVTIIPLMATFALGYWLGLPATSKESQLALENEAAPKLSYESESQSQQLAKTKAALVEAKKALRKLKSAEKRQPLNQEHLPLANASHCAHEDEEGLYQADEDSPEIRDVLITEHFELVGAKELIEDSFKAVPDMLGANLDGQQKDQLQELFTKYFGWDAIGEGFYKIYTDTYSARELQQMNRFYHTDLGRMIIDRSPELTKKTMVLMQKIMKENALKLKADLKKIRQGSNSIEKPAETH